MNAKQKKTPQIDSNKLNELLLFNLQIKILHRKPKQKILIFNER